MLVQELDKQFGLSDKLVFREEGGLVMACISNQLASCKVSLYGAQVLSYIPRGQEDLLFMSSSSVLEEGKAIRGGVPLCFPWFGPNKENPDAPKHGFARLLNWELKAAEQLVTGATRLVLTLNDSVLTRQWWDFRFASELVIEAGEELSVKWQVKNLSEVPVIITNALHSYFSVGAIAQVRVEGLSGVPYMEEIRSDEAFTGDDDAIVIQREVDRVYTDTTAACRIVDAAMNRSLLVKKSGSQSTVVWNPWADLARQMVDLGDTDYQHFVCVETANVGHNAVEIEPQSAHVMQMTVSLA
jgi:glucose-6-phosphate 1-epimerase